jgi:hypothetical protein
MLNYGDAFRNRPLQNGTNQTGTESRVIGLFTHMAATVAAGGRSHIPTD